jgi:LmbE family N-acetylglucosaminyl deacetylase
MKKVLVVAAHPDDEILGCGATIAKLVSQGYECYTLILGEGKTSRLNCRKKSEVSEELEQLSIEITNANKIIGVKEVFTADFPDNRFDSVDLLDIVKKIEKIKEIVKPDIIFTHFKNDLNIDHQVTYKAVVTATRPMENECVKEIYSFEVLSSTEWNFPLSFSPNIYFDVKDTIETKIQSMREYKSELCDYPHPRSLDGIKLNSEFYGMRVGKKYVEAFECIRMVR